MRIWPLPKIDFMPFQELEESRDVAVITSEPAWGIVEPRLHLPIVWQGDIYKATPDSWQFLALKCQGEVVYAVGGGVAVDAAKYVAARRNLPLVCLPTALTVDAFLTWASGMRQDGCVRYVETKPPNRLVVDLEVLAAAPAALRAAGICDVLSIATGSWDWRLADNKGLNPSGMTYVPYVDQVARSILQGALDCAEAAGRADPQGLKQLLDCLALEVQLCNQIGHSRPEEGSEHYFAYAAESEMGKGLPHGNLVGPGILLMAERQMQDVGPLRQALLASGVPLDTVPAQVVERTLRRLPAYVRRHDLPYGIAHELGGDTRERTSVKGLNRSKEAR